MPDAHPAPPHRTDPPEAAAVLDFWFGPPDDPQHGQPRAAWFTKDPAFDAEIARRFGPLIQRGLDGGLRSWWQPLTDARRALAAIVVLDQFTRNTGRPDGPATARAFAGDPQALAIAQALVASGLDRSLAGVERQFAYLPFEHAEDRALQQRSVELFRQLGQDHPALAGLLEWAEKHQVIVQRFGRFPHRNAALGRTSTPEEADFLLTPGSGF